MPRADPAPATTQSGARRPRSSPGPPALPPQNARTNRGRRASTRPRNSESWSAGNRLPLFSFKLMLRVRRFGFLASRYGECCKKLCVPDPPDTKSCCRISECLEPGRSQPPTARVISGPETPTGQFANWRFENFCLFSLFVDSFGCRQHFANSK